LEYNLALGPRNEDETFSGYLAEDVFVAAFLADRDEAINSGKTTWAKCTLDAHRAFFPIAFESEGREDGCTTEEVIASEVYAMFAKRKVSKAIAAQYMAERLLKNYKNGILTSGQLRSALPTYLVEAIDYVTGETPHEAEANEGENDG
jgi:putative ATP-dependent endonuclease of OLD family